MANQINPNVYHLSCRCPIEDVAALKTLASDKGVSLNECLVDLVHGAVKNVSVNTFARAWMQEQRLVNLKIRAHADELTANGKYRAKHPKKRGRPSVAI